MKTKALLLLIAMFVTTFTYAQKPAQGGLFENFGVGVKTGLLYGAGVDFTTSLHKNVKLRAGYTVFGLDVMKYVDIDGDQTVTKGDISFSNANLLFDLFPGKGIFHVTGGLYFGKNDISIAGRGDDSFALSNDVITPDQNGNFSGTVKLGSSVKPYLGLGLGRTIPNRRIGFKFDLGVVFQGAPRIESPNLNKNINPETVEDSFDVDVINNLKIWPMMNFSLIYRIK